MPNVNYFYYLFLFACFIGAAALIMLIVWRILQKKKVKSEPRATMTAKSYDYALPPQDELFPLASMAAGQVSNWGRDLLNPAVLYDDKEGDRVYFVCDTAGLFDHFDLVDNCLPEYNRDFSDAPDNIDHQGHGTHCAGIIAGVDNDHGVIGIDPKGKLVAIKVLNDEGVGAYTWLIKALYYIADLNVGNMRKIITMSLSGPTFSQELSDAVNYAESKGCFLFSAGGNSGYTKGKNSLGYPAREKAVTSVSSTTDRGVSTFSSGGAEIDIAAPGSNIFSTYINGGYVHQSGSSMACPAAAAMGGLILAKYPSITNQKQLQAFMVLHATDWWRTGWDERTGAGVPIADKYLGHKEVIEYPGLIQSELARDIFKGCLRAKEIKKMPESVLLNIGDYCDIAVEKKLKVKENREIIIKALGL